MRDSHGMQSRTHGSSATATQPNTHARSHLSRPIRRFMLLARDPSLARARSSRARPMSTLSPCRPMATRRPYVPPAPRPPVLTPVALCSSASARSLSSHARLRSTRPRAHSVGLAQCSRCSEPCCTSEPFSAQSVMLTSACHITHGQQQSDMGAAHGRWAGQGHRAGCCSPRAPHEPACARAPPAASPQSLPSAPKSMSQEATVQQAEAVVARAAAPCKRRSRRRPTVCPCRRRRYQRRARPTLGCRRGTCRCTVLGLVRVEARLLGHLAADVLEGA